MKPANALPAAPEGFPPLDPQQAAMAAEALAPDQRELDWDRLAARITAADGDLKVLRHLLASGQLALRKAFLDGAPASRLVRDRARLIDLLVNAAWARLAAPVLPDAALVAIGGYGRGELHPCSDVDLLILLDGELPAGGEEALAGLLAQLWDLGLEIGHSVRTVADCVAESRRDISTLTSLMEARLLAGRPDLLAAMNAALAPEQLWPPAEFYSEKLREQRARHARFDDTAYNLEPNIKSGPGTLRDIHILSWITLRRYGSADLQTLVEQGLMTDVQLRILRRGQEFLWYLRFALHTLTGRREDRLLFDHQIRIAQLLGYRDGTYMLGVEQFMQRFYRTVMDISRINEMMLQLFEEQFFGDPQAVPIEINPRFQVLNGYLQIADDEVFERHPSALLELFLLLQQNPELKGVAALTITAVRRNLDLIDDAFRQDPRNQALFLQILRAPEGVTHELRRMNLYGVLGRYIPAFGRVVGRMQYDLFHAYTVDAHTLFVVSNLRRFALPRFNDEFPLCSEIMQSLPAPELAYLAGLFHDIAKGRGGDHSELGAVEAEAFCREHGLSDYDARLVAWLVRHHLLLSLTAQKKDLSDPDVIREFAETVGDETHLDYLYVLTVADVRATNPKLWNSWRAQLFEELRSLAKQALRRGLGNPIDQEQLLADRRQRARALLRAAGLSDAQIDEVWQAFNEAYFLQCRVEEIQAHTQLLAEPGNRDRKVLVDVREQSHGAGTAVFLFTPRKLYTFAMATAVLDELGLTIADARILPLPNERSLATFVVLESDGQQIRDVARILQIQQKLEDAMHWGPEDSPTVSRRAPRQFRMFPTPPMVSFATDEKNRRTVMELVCGDRPGILAEVGKILRNHGMKIETAKVMTIGARAEDVFYIRNRDNEPLSQAEQGRLAEELETALAPLGPA